MLEFNATFFVAMFSFILFMIIMNAILYEPITRIQKERDELVNRENEAANITVQKTEVLREQQKSAIEKSKIIAKENFNKKVSEYKLRRDNILDASKNLAKKDLAIANAELEGDRREAYLRLEPKVYEMASMIASKVLGFDTKIKEGD